MRPPSSAIAERTEVAYHVVIAGAPPARRRAFQSRLTVMTDTWSSSATSSSRKPPKNRSRPHGRREGRPPPTLTAGCRDRAARRRRSPPPTHRTAESGTRRWPRLSATLARAWTNENPPHGLRRDGKEVRAILSGPGAKAALPRVSPNGLLHADVPGRDAGGDPALRVLDGRERESVPLQHDAEPREAALDLVARFFRNECP